MTMESAIFLKVLLWGASVTSVGIWVIMSALILREILKRRSERSATITPRDTYREET